MSLKGKFDKLEPKQKKNVIWLMIGIVILVVTLTGYNLRSDKAKTLISGNKSKKIQLDTNGTKLKRK